MHFDHGCQCTHLGLVPGCEGELAFPSPGLTCGYRRRATRRLQCDTLSDRRARAWAALDGGMGVQVCISLSGILRKLPFPGRTGEGDADGALDAGGGLPPRAIGAPAGMPSLSPGWSSPLPLSSPTPAEEAMRGEGPQEGQAGLLGGHTTVPLYQLDSLGGLCVHLFTTLQLDLCVQGPCHTGRAPRAGGKASWKRNMKEKGERRTPGRASGL